MGIKLTILLIILLFCINTAVAIDYIQIGKVNIDSFGGLIEESDVMYSGSVIRYNILLYTHNISDNQIFEVVITNPIYEVIENRTFYFNGAMPNYFISSNASGNEWILIYADVPGIYKLVLSSKTSAQLSENTSTFFRHDYSLPFYFEVKSPQEKRLSDANAELIKRNEEIANQSETINKDILNYTKNTYIASLLMLLFVIVTLFSTCEGRNTFFKFVKIVLIIIVIIVFSIFFIAFIISLLFS